MTIKIKCLLECDHVGCTTRIETYAALYEVDHVPTEIKMRPEVPSKWAYTPGGLTFCPTCIELPQHLYWKGFQRP